MQSLINPKTHELHCQDPWFTLIRNGKKIVEGRKNLAKFKSWAPGDIIIFKFKHNFFKAQITAMRRYKSLEEYLDCEGISKVLPGINTKEEAIKIYLQWSSLEEIKKYGFLAIEIRLIKNSD